MDEAHETLSGPATRRILEREVQVYGNQEYARLDRLIRQPWGIGNKLHWVLDVGFGEDLDRKRAGHAAQNFSLLNRIAPYLLKLLGI